MIKSFHGRGHEQLQGVGQALLIEKSRTFLNDFDANSGQRLTPPSFFDDIPRMYDVFRALAEHVINSDLISSIPDSAEQTRAELFAKNMVSVSASGALNAAIFTGASDSEIARRLNNALMWAKKKGAWTVTTPTRAALQQASTFCEYTFRTLYMRDAQHGKELAPIIHFYERLADALTEEAPPQFTVPPEPAPDPYALSQSMLPGWSNTDVVGHTGAPGRRIHTGEPKRRTLKTPRSKKP